MRFLSDAIHDLNARDQRRALDRHAHAYALGVRGDAAIDYAIGKTQALPRPTNLGAETTPRFPTPPRPSPQKAPPMKRIQPSAADLSRLAAEHVAIERARAAALALLRQKAEEMAKKAEIARGLGVTDFQAAEQRYRQATTPTQTTAEQEAALDEIAARTGVSRERSAKAKAERDALIRGGK
jgi:hypothetical protein